jgi:hypothetical protein
MQARVVTAARRRGARGEDEVVASELEEASIAWWGANGNEAVHVRRRAVVKRDWNRVKRKSVSGEDNRFWGRTQRAWGNNYSAWKY